MELLQKEKRSLGTFIGIISISLTIAKFFPEELAKQFVAYLPFVAGLIGASAVTIGIQQLYLSRILKNNHGNLFESGAICLLGFGAFTIMHVTHVLGFIPKDNLIVHIRTELIIFFFSCAALYRTVAALLYSNNTEKFQGKWFPIFKAGTNEVKTDYSCAALFIFSLVAIFFDPNGITYIELAQENSSFEFLKTLKIENYLPFSKQMSGALILIVLGFTTLIISMYVLFIMDIVVRENKEKPEGVLFFTAMLTWFIFFPINQTILVKFEAIGFPILIAFNGVLILAVWACLNRLMENGFPWSKHLFRSIVGPLIASSFICLVFPMEDFPFFYFGLAGLTFAFAYLPARQIERDQTDPQFEILKRKIVEKLDLVAIQKLEMDELTALKVEMLEQPTDGSIG